MPTTPQRLPQSLDHQDTISEKKPHTILTAQSVAQRPIWEVIVEIEEQIPDEEWAKVPSDAYINYKHRATGDPRRRRRKNAIKSTAVMRSRRLMRELGLASIYFDRVG